MRLHYSAISDVGRVRKDNQDSGYAGPWLLTVCDGVGGAARGDVASSTAVQQIRRLDREPEGDPLSLIAGALHRAHDRIGELVDDDPALAGTSTTAVVGLLDGHQMAFGHIGDSRAYLLHEGELRQLTKDHTFVQGLIDEGRITPDEAHTHPHRNLILKALDSVQEVEPDLFKVDLALGDRLLVCSDGVLSLTDDRIRDILASGTPDFAAVELVRAALAAGSTDNITSVVAEIVEEPPPDLEPLLVGAAADLPRRAVRGGGTFFRGHRAGDTGELEPIGDDVVVASSPARAPLDPETARYAPRPAPRLRWLRRLFATITLLGVAAMIAGAGKFWAEQQYYVGERDGVVTIFRGVQGDLLGYQLSTPFETTNVSLDHLSELDADQVRSGSDSVDLDEARRIVESYHAAQLPPSEAGG